MNWFFFKKKQSLNLSPEAIERINEESRKLGIPQVLVLDLKQNPKDIGQVLIRFADRIPTDSGYLRCEGKDTEKKLSFGELRYELGKFYFYPNIDLEWKKTPNPGIQKITSNYTFSEVPIYLEKEEFYKLKPILKDCFLREGVASIYIKGTSCQLEICDLTLEKEKRISDDLLTYLSSLYQGPWEE
ncbi:hypothetical protein [Leptospira brenneri]|uniref:Uncharacterized protein n=1 Tax=Leptospira brenneri TaxID=2023182 RepID=A0A2M9Y1F4_9LEPT|nr:hypothetical protein [Leptospira brenneri]PJZ45309.1 hypothetical protein CH361_09720 [Leptospira brenneri]TGK91798.1 hypothetical protein EHQ30_16530 [Leptospira brenneri]